MGSCASLYNKSDCSAVKVPAPAPETAADKFEIVPSPIKHFKLSNNTKSNIKDISLISHHYKTNSGSKEEVFFESRTCLDSDCEDFFSVNGDFPPSCGNTPVHNSTPETPRASKVGTADEPVSLNRSPLPTKRRKKLAELFRESVAEDTKFGFKDNRKADEPFVSGTGSVSGGGGDKLADGNTTRSRSKLCCFPSVVSSHSWSKRKEELN